MALKETLELDIKQAQTRIRSLGAELQKQFSNIKIPPITVPPIKVPPITIPKTIIPPLELPPPNLANLQGLQSKIAGAIGSITIPPITVPAPNISGFRATVSSAVSHVIGSGQAIGHAFTNAAAVVGTGLATIGNSFITAAAVVGRGIKSIGLPAALLAGGTLKASIDFETAFAGVRKTVEATEPQLLRLRDGIRDMAKQLPASAVEIAGVAEAAGQLGIKTENILGFTRVMVDLGETTNLSALEAANALARLANITQLPQDQFDRLGSTIVELGNKSASTEAEITEMALRIAGAGKQVGLSEAEILGFSSALSSVGINAEAGGSSISRAFIKVSQAVSEGGAKLDLFAKIAGTTTKEFAQKFKDDAGGAIAVFLTGLGKVKEEGGDTFAVLEDLGLTEQRLRDALLRLGGAGGLLNEQLAIGRKEWGENNALSTEAAKRYETTASQLSVLKNRIIDAAQIVGGALAPTLVTVGEKVSQIVTKFGEFFDSLSPKTRELVGGILLVVGALGALVALPFVTVSATVIGVLAAIAAVGGAFVVLRDRSEGFRNAITSITNFIQDEALPAFQRFVAKVVEVFQKWFQQNKGLLKGVQKDFQEVFRELSKFWETHGESIKQVLKVIATVVGGTIFVALKALLFGIANNLRLLAAALKVVGVVLPVVSSLFTILGSVIRVTAGVIEAIWNALTTAATSAWTGIQAVVSGFTNWYNTNVASKITATSEAIAKAWGFIKIGAMVAWDFVQRVIREFLDWYSQNVTPVISAVTDLIAAVWNRLVQITRIQLNFWKTIISGIITAATALWDKFGDEIVSAVKRGWDNLVTITVLAGKAILAPIAITVLAIKALWDNFGRSIVEAVQRHFTLAARTVSTILVGIRDLVFSIFEAIKGIIEGALQTIQGIIQIFTGLIKGDWDTFWLGIQNTFSGVWAIIQAIIQAALDQVRIIIQTALSFIGVLWNAAWSALTFALSSAWENMKAVWGTIIAWFVGLPGLARDALVGAAGVLYDAGATLLGKFRDGFESAWKSFREWIETIPGTIKNILGDIGTGGASLTDLTGAGLAVRGGKAILKQRGGPVQANQSYVVGEKRPELFIPSVPGVILPRVPTLSAMSTGTMHRLSQGGNTAVVNVYVNPPAGMSQKEANDLGGLIGQASKKAIQTSVRAI